MSADSSSTARDSFDSPCRRSTNVIGHFGDPRALSGGDKQHLDQKRVSVGDEAIERHGGQRLAPPAPVTARAVAGGQPRDLPDVDVREAAQQPPACRPVDDRAAWHIARADHDVRLSGRGNQRRQMTWIVRQIRVHLADDIDGLVNAPRDAVDVRASQAALAGAVHDVDPPRVRARQPVGHRARAVR